MHQLVYGAKEEDKTALMMKKGLRSTIAMEKTGKKKEQARVAATTALVTKKRQKTLQQPSPQEIIPFDDEAFENF